jgi:hypothetical protein
VSLSPAPTCSSQQAEQAGSELADIRRETGRREVKSEHDADSRLPQSQARIPAQHKYRRREQQRHRQGYRQTITSSPVADRFGWGGWRSVVLECSPCLPAGPAATGDAFRARVGTIADLRPTRAHWPGMAADQAILDSVITSLSVETASSFPRGVRGSTTAPVPSAPGNPRVPWRVTLAYSRGRVARLAFLGYLSLLVFIAVSSGWNRPALSHLIIDWDAGRGLFICGLSARGLFSRRTLLCPCRRRDLRVIPRSPMPRVPTKRVHRSRRHESVPFRDRADC